jgi:hypothetical protein
MTDTQHYALMVVKQYLKQRRLIFYGKTHL